MLTVGIAIASPCSAEDTIDLPRVTGCDPASRLDRRLAKRPATWPWYGRRLTGPYGTDGREVNRK